MADAELQRLRAHNARMVSLLTVMADALEGPGLFWDAVTDHLGIQRHEAASTAFRALAAEDGSADAAIAALTPTSEPVYGVLPMLHGHAVRRAFAAGASAAQFSNDGVYRAWLVSPTRGDLRALLSDEEVAAIDRAAAPTGGYRN